ncbi:MAG TPA: hypothetical protein VFU15_03320 [Bacteroidia bacterium]|nr:hypothetical protein [Bacteroidia bacterium]
MAQKIYNGEAIRKMTALFKPFSTPAYNWLMEKGHRELIEAAEFLKDGNQLHFRWLVDNKHFEMGAFINAVKGDKDAFRWLMQNKSIFWAATANAINKDREAKAWLKANNFIVYAELADAIVEFEKGNNDDIAGYYRPPI